MSDGQRLRKPRSIEFMLRGYELSDALVILERWDSLSEQERRDLGFMESERLILLQNIIVQGSA